MIDEHTGWCRAKDGHVEKCRVVVREGDVCAPGEILKVMEAPTPTQQVSHGD